MSNQKAEYGGKVAGVEGLDEFILEKNIEVVCTLDPNHVHFISTNVLVTSQKLKGHTFVFCDKHKDFMDVTYEGDCL